MGKLKQAIIEKIHGLPWEEAKWKEAESNQCNFKYKSTWFLDEWYDLDPYSQCFYDKDNRKMIEYLECGGEFETEFKILGQPITLSRVLQALWNSKRELGISGYEVYFEGDNFICRFATVDFENIVINWKLLKEDKSTATLEDQSPETIQALESIFLTQEDSVRAENICLIDLSGNGNHLIPKEDDAR